jgi:hypothetical protein
MRGEIVSGYTGSFGFVEEMKTGARLTFGNRDRGQALSFVPHVGAYTITIDCISVKMDWRLLGDGRGTMDLHGYILPEGPTRRRLEAASAQCKQRQFIVLYSVEHLANMLFANLKLGIVSNYKYDCVRAIYLCSDPIVYRRLTDPWILKSLQDIELPSVCLVVGDRFIRQQNSP